MTGGYSLARVANIVVKLLRTIFLNRAKSAALLVRKRSSFTRTISKKVVQSSSFTCHMWETRGF